MTKNRYENKETKLKKGYLAIDVGMLQMDCKAKMTSKQIDTDELSVLSVLEVNGMSRSTFNNAYHNYYRPARESGVRNKDIVDNNYILNGIAKPGVIQQIYYITILKLFNLEDVYRLKLKSEAEMETKQKIKEDVSSNITSDDISELRVDIRMLTKSIMLLAETIQQTNARQKPKAILPDRKEVL